jgi:DNA-binding LacI/PurR family transcriptional regulator
MEKITIKDIAREMGVSISTVSRAFNNKYDINAETKAEILKKSAELGYAPNLFAKQLSSKKTFIIGVVVPEFINSFFPRVIKGIQSVMNGAGYQVLIMSSDESAQKEQENIQTLEKNNIDGIILSLSQDARDITYLKKVIEKNIHFVQFNRVNYKLDTPKIVFEDYKWAYIATEHLLKQGYRKIYHLAGPINLIVAHIRLNGFNDAMKKYNNRFDPKTSFFETGIFIEDGERIAERLIKSDNVPEAFFCFNDPVAIGAMEVFKAHGYRIPEDVAFVGFTESLIAPHIGLTSVEQPAEELGFISAQTLLKMFHGDMKDEKTTLRLDGKLNIRSSSVKKN